jgi:urease accessory protein UreF
MTIRAPAVLYALADGRATAGGPVYPDGIESARIDDLNALRLFLLGHLYGRLRTDRALAAEACRRGPTGFDTLAFEADRRAPSDVARDAARWRGRRLLGLARRSWGEGLASWPEELPEPVALGALAWYGDVSPDGADALALYAGIASPAWAVARQLRLDPRDVAALVVDLCAAAPPAAPAGVIPEASSPLAEAAAKVHARRRHTRHAS